MNSKVSILCDLSLQGLIGHETQPRLHRDRNRDPLGSGPAPRLHVFSLKNCQFFWLPKWEVWEVHHKKGTFEQFEQVQALTSGSFPASQPPLCQSPLQYQSPPKIIGN